MRFKMVLVFLGLFLGGNNLVAQQLKWYQPAFVEGVCVTDPANIFHRLPASMKATVRTPVWDLSLQTAGEFIHFKTTANTIQIKYSVTNKTFGMPHMPATGRSGLDLYAMDRNGVWNWSAAKYSFGDTCSYVYKNLTLERNAKGEVDFYVYLPLYNTVEWLTIGVPENETFEFAEKRKDKPIVAYGTSIAQGAVASRPGMAWTNILHRNLDRTIVNLGFSGNGTYEDPLFELMSDVDAALYLLDCLPNLSVGFTDAEIKKRVRNGVKILRRHNKEVPILFAEHAGGYSPYFMDTARLREYHNTSIVMAAVFKELIGEGVKNIYLVTEKEVGFDINSTTEGSHPNDIGMMKLAEAYEKKIREILHEKKGAISTMIPVQQSRDGYDWMKRFDAVNEAVKSNNPSALIIGNSIVNFWGGLPVGMMVNGPKEWDQYMKPLNVQNAGFGWDRIENVLWRVYHGALDDFKGSDLVLMIGTNNFKINTDEEIVAGLDQLVKAIKLRQPKARLTMVGILPRYKMEDQVRSINLKIKKMALDNRIPYLDMGKEFSKGNLFNADLFLKDGLHPNAKGYEVMGKVLEKLLKGKNR